MVKLADFLPRRVILERRREVAGDELRGDDDVVVVQEPVPVRVRGDVGALVRIGPQIEDLGQSQGG